MHIIGQGEGGTYGGLASTHDDDVVYVLIFLLTNNALDMGDVLLGSHEIGQVVSLQHIHATRDDGLITTLQGHDVIGIFGAAEVAYGLVQNLTGVAQLHAQQHQRTVMHIQSLAYP